MKQSPSWEANRFAASQEIPHILWNPKVHYRIQKSPSTVSLLSQFIPVHTLTSYFLKIHFNLLKPTGHVMHHQLNIQQLYALPTLYLSVLYLSENKQRLVPLTS
jgi:hypothetical protein